LTIVVDTSILLHAKHLRLRSCDVRSCWNANKGCHVFQVIRIELTHGH